MRKYAVAAALAAGNAVIAKPAEETPLIAAEAVRILHEAGVPPDALADAALAEARRYLNSSPFSIRRIKSLVWQGLERDLSEHMAAHVEAMSAAFKSEDHKEGVAAFLERRPARFTGR